MNNISIRIIEEKDNRAAAALIRKTLEEFRIPKQGTVYSDPTTDDLYTLFRSPRSVFYVAYRDDVLMGCCGVYPTSGLPLDCAEPVKFYVDGSARGMGIGRTLMQLSLDFAMQAGYAQLYLETFPDFSTAIAMYQKFGFRPLGHSLGNSGHTSCNVWMIKDFRMLHPE